jgi:hypothetical protein
MIRSGMVRLEGLRWIIIIIVIILLVRVRIAQSV